MKIKLGPYVDSSYRVMLHNNYMYNKHGWDYDENTNLFEGFLEKLQDTINYLLDTTLNKIVTRKRKESIHIDDFDIWGMDYTLASIVYPMLIKLKAVKHGSQIVDDEDVPVRLRTIHVDEQSDEWYPLTDKKWTYVLDKMIWAFSEEAMDDPIRLPHHTDVVYYKEIYPSHHERATHGRILFAKYYRGLWD